MINPIPTATYRIQLRGSVDFAEVERHLDYYRELGISHLYLSPIFTASSGSTHGYDVIDPTEIEPALGGAEGFRRLAQAAHAKGLGIILDIVPNHTGFTLENPWLRDVLVHGRASRYADYFDIDWSAGPLVLPFLPEPFGTMLQDERFSVEDGHWCFEGMKIPLAAGEAAPASATREALEALHARQHWRLRHWEIERDGISHRRFFNITSLIGMRVEDPEVFADTHSLIIDLVQGGLVDGLRVDHIDGLADPKGYLDRLAAALPDTPVWIEKILVGDETIPEDWKTAGTTGYESARLIARLLTDEKGIEALDQNWRDYAGVDESFELALATAKSEILQNELAAELHQLVALGGQALSTRIDVEAGPEGLREAVSALLSGMTRYRTYLDASGARAEDRALISAIADRARGRLRSPRILDALVSCLLEPQDGAATRFGLRMQQVSGALLAKAQEDTAGFRWTRFIAANEVGAEPAEPLVSQEEATAFVAGRRHTEMNLTSSHDTKRSEDSRMRLAAISHHPEAFARLVSGFDDSPVSPKWRWYIAQSALAIWGEEKETLKSRLHEHLLKAMREAKEQTFWTKPDEGFETAATQFAAQLCDTWAATQPSELAQLTQTGEMLSLTQLALKCLMPGFPDIYRGGEGPFYALTDPDNRLPIDWPALSHLSEQTGFAGDKNRLTRTLLALRKAEQIFFDQADARIEKAPDRIALLRSHAGRTLVAEQWSGTAEFGGEIIWQGTYGNTTLSIGWR